MIDFFFIDTIIIQCYSYFGDNMDVSFKCEKDRFKLRVTGIIIDEDKVLLDKHSIDNKYRLPGGRVSLNESSDVAIIRELEEEIGFKFSIEKFIGTAEEFYVNYNNEKTHCINLYYKVKFSNPDDINKLEYNRLEDDHGVNVQHSFVWVKFSDLENVNLVPNEIKKCLINDETNIHYIINDIKYK